MKWHTRQEIAMIRKYGGRPMQQYGYDGLINGSPVEVRAARKDTRYRIQKDVHRHLVANQGSYIFVKNGQSKRMSASRVSDKLSRGSWFKDRNYPHKFLMVDEVF